MFTKQLSILPISIDFAASDALILLVMNFWETAWLIGMLTLMALLAIVAFYIYRLRSIYKKAALEKQVQDLELKAIRVQMNPHFMFNALNSVRYYILKEERNKASDYLTHFSKLLRNMMAATRENFTPLEDELRSLELYLEFEKARFDNKFDYEINVAPEVRTSQVKIQPLILQPFAENAVWHGLMKKEEKGHLQVDIGRNDRNLLITITDNGMGRKAAALNRSKTYQSFGMDITRERLELLKHRSNEEVGFDIEDLYKNGKANGTRVTIKLPLT